MHFCKRGAFCITYPRNDTGLSLGLVIKVFSSLRVRLSLLRKAVHFCLMARASVFVPIMVIIKSSA